MADMDVAHNEKARKSKEGNNMNPIEPPEPLPSETHHFFKDMFPPPHCNLMTESASIKFGACMPSLGDLPRTSYADLPGPCFSSRFRWPTGCCVSRPGRRPEMRTAESSTSRIVCWPYRNTKLGQAIQCTGESLLDWGRGKHVKVKEMKRQSGNLRRFGSKLFMVFENIP